MDPPLRARAAANTRGTAGRFRDAASTLATVAEIVFIRHAESQWNAKRLWQGQADPPLSARGREQAHALAARLAGQGLRALVTSDLLRARETAAILAERLSISVELEAGLRELDVGRWSGHSHAEIAERWPEELARFRAGDAQLRPGGGEPRARFRERVATALAGVASSGAGTVGVVAHLGVLRSLRPGAELANADFLVLDSALTQDDGTDYPGAQGPEL